MSLVDYAGNDSKRSDLQQKTTYNIVILSVFNPPQIAEDPSASVQIINDLFYLLVEGKYNNFIDPPSSEYSQLVNFRGSVIGFPGDEIPNAGYVNLWLSNPAGVIAPPGKTLFVFGCINAQNHAVFTPSIGVIISLDIALLPQPPVVVLDV